MHIQKVLNNSITKEINFNLIFLVVFSLFLFSCIDINQNHIGESGYPCYEDNSCDNSLVCIEGKICTDLCEKIECLSGKCIIESELPVCVCDNGYFLDENNKCIFDCSNVENSHVSKENDNCICNDDYIFKNNKCIFDCSNLEYSHANETNNGCTCDDNYNLNDDKCIFDCSNLEYSHINETNDGCVCDNLYILNEDNECIFDCSIQEFSHVNETNDGCVCDNLYILNEDNECIFDCSEYENSHVNNTNNSCICNENYQDHDNNSTCLIDCTSALNSGILSCPISCDDRMGSAICSCDDEITRENINNTQESAYLLTFDDNNSFIRENLTTGLSSCDEYTDDWYKVEMDIWDIIIVKIDFIHAEGDLDLELLNEEQSLNISNRSKVDTVNNITINYESFSYNTEVAGTFYLKVFNAFNTYKLTVTKNKVYNTYTYDNHEYRYFNIRRDWEEANTICEDMGYHLVTITDEGENDFIGNIIHDRTWIGLIQNVSNWEWVTGEDYEYSNLDFHLGDDCVVMRDYRNEWKTYECNRYSNFICEEN